MNKQNMFFALSLICATTCGLHADKQMDDFSTTLVQATDKADTLKLTIELKSDENTTSESWKQIIGIIQTCQNSENEDGEDFVNRVLAAIKEIYSILKETSTTHGKITINLSNSADEKQADLND